MSAPLLGQFLVAINGFVKVGNAGGLSSYLALEPPFGDQYNAMIQELRQVYPAGRETALEAECKRYLTAATSQWSAFERYMVQYLTYLRDVSSDPSKYLNTYEHLLNLQSKANLAFAQSTLGVLLLHTVIANASILCRLAIGLDRRPELLASRRSSVGGAESQRESLTERAANAVRSAFVTCQNDQSETSSGRPNGRQVGTYVLANLCLKIMFQCRKTNNAAQIFKNIINNAAPITFYPKSQQVTYLYYLGRYYFQNSHFYRAQLILQQAYDLSPANQQCTKQRRLILTYLTAANIVLGRFPSSALLGRPEAAQFSEHFIPLCQTIKQGNLKAFHDVLNPDGSSAQWLSRRRIFWQLHDRCEVLVWRSLVRKVFQMHGTKPARESRVAAQLDLTQVLQAFLALSPPASSSSSSYVDPDLEGMVDTLSTDYQATDDMAIESKLASLIEQGLVSGYISHERNRLAVLGAHKTDGDPVRAGFPNVWTTLSRKYNDEVPGWKTEVTKSNTATNPFGAGPGMVINLSGLKPIGAAG